MYRSGAFRQPGEPLRDRETFEKFCAMIPEGCFTWDEQAERTPFHYSPQHRLFYYLMAAFTMFVLDSPGHPVGMPFPGGFKVEDRNGTFYCLIRDREKRCSSQSAISARPGRARRMRRGKVRPIPPGEKTKPETRGGLTGSFCLPANRKRAFQKIYIVNITMLTHVPDNGRQTVRVLGAQTER